MLKGIKQSDKELLPVIREYGCLFLCFANASPMILREVKADKPSIRYGKKPKRKVISQVI